MSERSPAEHILAHQRRIDEINTEGQEPRSALEYVQDVYKGCRAADPWRMRAAIAALPFESPKLAVSTTILDEGDLADPLERAILRSQSPPKMIEHRPGETAPSVKWSGPLREG